MWLTLLGLLVGEKLMGIPIDDKGVTAFTAVIQVGAIIAAIIYFRNDIARFITGFVKGLRSAEARQGLQATREGPHGRPGARPETHDRRKNDDDAGEREGARRRQKVQHDRQRRRARHHRPEPALVARQRRACPVQNRRRRKSALHFRAATRRTHWHVARACRSPDRQRCRRRRGARLCKAAGDLRWPPAARRCRAMVRGLAC
ncbi:MAG: undecaprenyl-diphosphate phosphatase [Sphingopyxis sp.]|nr:undecaprenyl-diphosphate phosphatase [Sphingopyxis sp.]